MQHDRKDRMARGRNRGRRKSSATFHVEPRLPDDVGLVVPCPRCGAARVRQWETYRSDAAGRYRLCRGCGSRVFFACDGSARIVG